MPCLNQRPYNVLSNAASLNNAALGALYRPLIPHTLPAPVYYTFTKAFKGITNLKRFRSGPFKLQLLEGLKVRALQFDLEIRELLKTVTVTGRNCYNVSNRTTDSTWSRSTAEFALQEFYNSQAIECVRKIRSVSV